MAQSFRVFLLELKEGEGEGFDQVLGCDQDPHEKQYVLYRLLYHS